jgi:hypothetical protein
MVMSPDGGILTQSPTWLRYQDNLSVNDNPRLLADATRNRPFVWSAQQTPGPGGYAGPAYVPAAFLPRLGSPVTE